MKIDRLFGIVYLLIEKKSMTASELATHFEVSARTILRDVETLMAAGIPLYTTQGKGGGIAILDSFVLNKAALSNDEQERILLALQTLKAVEGPEADELLGKLGSLFQKSGSSWLEIDFSRWGIRSSIDNDKFEKLRNAIMSSAALRITYYSSNNQKSERTVYPLKLAYKDKSWYLQGYCQKKEDYRVFRVSRIKSIAVLPETFDLGGMTIPALEAPDIAYETITLKFFPAATHRVYDDFEESEITQNADDSVIVSACIPRGEWIYGYLLSYGALVEVLGPQAVREKLIEHIDSLGEIYGKGRAT